MTATLHDLSLFIFALAILAAICFTIGWLCTLADIRKTTVWLLIRDFWRHLCH